MRSLLKGTIKRTQWMQRSLVSGVSAERRMSLQAYNYETSKALPPTLSFMGSSSIEDQLNKLNNSVKENGIVYDAQGIIRWANNVFDGRLAMSTSFGIQSSVLLHAATQVFPEIPIVWIDTGMLPNETYHYAQMLTERLNLNLKVFSNTEWTVARMAALYGNLWEMNDVESHTLYGNLRKVIPFEQALSSLQLSENNNPFVLLSGLRASQTKARANMNIVNYQQMQSDSDDNGGYFKLLPLLKMTDDEVIEYMKEHDLPQHPLQSKGYVSVGDWHSSRPVQGDEDGRDTRFGGKFQECGLHVDSHEPVKTSMNVSPSPSPESSSSSSTDSSSMGNKSGLNDKLYNILDGLTRYTTVHPETDHAVIMVKKLMGDGHYCRKCYHISHKMEHDGISKYVSYIAVADSSDHSSEGAQLAKYFHVTTAPFFLVRSKQLQTNENNEINYKQEWKVVRSYLQLKKLLQTAIETVKEANESESESGSESETENENESENVTKKSVADVIRDGFQSKSGLSGFKFSGRRDNDNENDSDSVTVTNYSGDDYTRTLREMQLLREKIDKFQKQLDQKEQAFHSKFKNNNVTWVISSSLTNNEGKLMVYLG